MPDEKTSLTSHAITTENAVTSLNKAIWGYIHKLHVCTVPSKLPHKQSYRRLQNEHYIKEYHILWNSKQYNKRMQFCSVIGRLQFGQYLYARVHYLTMYCILFSVHGVHISFMDKRGRWCMRFNLQNTAYNQTTIKFGWNLLSNFQPLVDQPSLPMSALFIFITRVDGY